jgi:hypothetical protein
MSQNTLSEAAKAVVRRNTVEVQGKSSRSSTGSTSLATGAT